MELWSAADGWCVVEPKPGTPLSGMLFSEEASEEGEGAKRAWHGKQHNPVAAQGKRGSGCTTSRKSWTWKKLSDEKDGCQSVWEAPDPSILKIRPFTARASPEVAMAQRPEFAPAVKPRAKRRRLSSSPGTPAEIPSEVCINEPVRMLLLPPGAKPCCCQADYTNPTIERHLQ